MQWHTIEGTPVGKAWRFRTDKCDFAVYGPYIRFLVRGSYRATFKLKLEHVGVGDRLLLQIDVASNFGQKRIKAGDLTASDFGKDDEYREFPLDFEVVSYAVDVEFRVISKGSGDLVTFHSVKLERR